jgi:MoaA/NifB/PqqE/SkfB family radical SAM enzyme
MNVIDRAVRHARLTANAMQEAPSPPFVTLFINSICNQKCEHCFYWKNLNRKDDLTQEELFALSRSMGRIENLNLSGGEPFLRKDFAIVCKQFIRHNQVRQIYVPTNAYFPDRIVDQISQTLEEKELDLFAVEISLDGTFDFHDEFRRSKGSFVKAMETYDALATLQERDARLRIHASSTATDINMDELKRLTTFLFERCPKMDHHNLSLIRGDRKNPSLQGPTLEQYRELYTYIRRLWRPREEGRYGGIVEPMLQHVKVRAAAERRQIVPCTAGRISTVIFSNGDVSVCEQHAPLGNLRQKTFPEIWQSPEARAQRKSIAARDCHCTAEMPLWPSIVFQPAQMAKVMLEARPWQHPEPLRPEELVRVDQIAPAPAIPSPVLVQLDGDSHQS